MSFKTALNLVSENKSKQIHFCIFAIIAIFLMVAIFAFSAQDAERSSKIQGQVNEFINKKVDDLAENLSTNEQTQIKRTVSIYLRKSAHVLLFSALGFFACGAFIFFDRPKSILIKAALALAVCVFYAGSDEIHQLFVKERSGEFLDVIIDSVSAAVGILFMVGIFAIFKIIRRKKQKNK